MDKSNICVKLCLLVFLLGHYYAVVSTLQKGAAKDYTWLHWRTWTRLSLKPARSSEAYEICRLEGRMLASPTNAQLYNAFRHALNHVPGVMTGWFARPNVTNYFHDTYASTYGGYYGYHFYDYRYWNKFAPGYPKNPITTRRCLVLTSGNLLKDHICETEEWPFICYRDGERMRPSTTSCNLYDKEYTLLSTGWCYRLHNTGLPWRRALSSCYAEGANLVILESATEAKLMVSLIKQHADKKLKTDYGHDNETVFAGIYKVFSPDSDAWYTIYGEPLSSTGFTAFDSSSASQNEKACGGFLVTGNGAYTDLDCLKSYRYICKKSPNLQL